MNIKVMGPGCPKCAEAEKIVKTVIAETGIDAVVEKVSDFQEIAKHGVFSTPAVVIDGKIKCVGKVPSKKEVEGWLK
ncbi:MAG: TM0996/MTH895 family glutaredoxin-like protein [Proteobacteria bacterium]|nr:TM0996/MTH895 family glutaredoxin-like protein [Pseudomonadota bacterium]MBU1688604.1 TM0996/MTH895 family glutaredoxin-like protein [Pseudomonadota bacterium]